MQSQSTSSQVPILVSRDSHTYVIVIVTTISYYAIPISQKVGAPRNKTPYYRKDSQMIKVRLLIMMSMNSNLVVELTS